jgi:FKBP-type peptidyl-prolyl cis-trans isomerase FklB
MPRNFFKISIFIVFVTFIASCQDQSSVVLAKWKADNDKYFVNMKDSTGWVNYTIPNSTDSYFYKIKSQGNQTSNSPLASDVVKVNYRGSLINGVIFDKTYVGLSAVDDPGATPRSFYVNYLIPGFIDNLKNMKIGEIRSIVLPQQLGYGATSTGAIPPYSVTMFDIQLISIN